jgi:hypothetical protein
LEAVAKPATNFGVEVRYSKGGKVVLTTHSKISANGKTLTVNLKGTDVQGKPVVGVVVYDKQ